MKHTKHHPPKIALISLIVAALFFVIISYIAENDVEAASAFRAVSWGDIKAFNSDWHEQEENKTDTSDMASFASALASSDVPPPNFKVAILGDTSIREATRDVFQLIKDEGADMVIHQGDMDNSEEGSDSPQIFDEMINEILGENFPFFITIGNHDLWTWDDANGIQELFEARLARIEGAECIGEYGEMAACSYQGIFFLQSGIGLVGGSGDEYAAFMKEQLSQDNHIWRICSWHMQMNKMQVGAYGDNTGWEVYEACREGGAFVVNGHEHSYARTYLMDSFENQIIANTSSTLELQEGKSFALHSGLGGHSIRVQVEDWPWFDAIYTSTQGANYGALFCTFNIDGQPDRASCYFKDIDGVVPDEFELVSKIQAAPTPSFVDVPSDHWAFDYIEALYQNGYVAGCSEDPRMYCPEDRMTRAEGAVFVLRGEYGGGYLPAQPSEPLFSDTPMEAWYTKWADQLYQEGYTVGCSTDPLKFCPLQAHSIAEASVFFLRMKHNPHFYPSDPQHIFSDIPEGAWYERWVEQAYIDGILLPCQTSPELQACAEEPITRAMAAFMMVQAKDLMPPETGIFVDNSVLSGGDGSLESPFKTINEGLGAAIAGDTIYIRGDVEGREYNESLVFQSAGTALAPITLRSYPGEKVIIASSSRILRLDQPFWHFVDLIFDHKNGTGDALQIRGGHHALFRNVEIRNGLKYGIQIFDGNHVIIENSRIHSFDTGVEGNDAHCICTDPTNSSYSVENLQLLNNVIYDCSGDGIQFYAVDSTPISEYAIDILLQGNIFYKNPGFYGENAIDSKGAENVRVLDNEIYGFDSNKAVVLQKGSSNFHFEGNIIHDSHRGIEMRGEGGKSQSGHVLVRNTFYNIYGEYVMKFDDVDLGVVQHNTVVNNDSEFIRIEEEGLTHGDIRNNLIFATGRPNISGTFEAEVGFNGWFTSDPGLLAQTTDITGTDPLFVDISIMDFHLQEGSPAIDAGTDLGDPYHGAASDLGAFER